MINNVVEGIALLPYDIKQNIKYAIVGAGPEDVKIKELINHYKLENVVTMVGAFIVMISLTIFYFQICLYCLLIMNPGD